MTMGLDPFAGLGNAKPNAGGNYILEGQHLLEIDECKRVDSPHKGTVNFVCTFRVKESSASKPESSVSVVFALKHAPAMSGLRHFLAAARDKEFDAVDGTDANWAVDKKQPLKGVLIYCEGFPHITGAGKKITKYHWHSVKP